MKFGLMLAENTDNIGDDIQSYAALKFLPQVDFYIDREKLHSFCGDGDGQKTAVIMNAWYMYHKFHWPPSPYIHPLFISMHISVNDYYQIGTKFLDGPGGDYLRKYEPIGARDESTKELLKEKNIKSYVSGCLTLTLDQFDNIEMTDNIYLVDLEEEDRKKLKQYYPNEKFEELTHFVSYENVGFEERMLKAEALLKRYQGAKCVVTSRLHCALPCLALGTPVLLVYKEENKDRMESFLPFLHVTSSQDIAGNTFWFDMENPAANKLAYRSVRDQLKQKCMDFVKRSQDEQRECGQRDIYKILNWQAELINGTYGSFIKQISELKEWCEELQQGKNWLESQYANVKHDYEKLQKWCAELLQGKDWLEEEYHKIQKENRALKQGNERLEEENSKIWEECEKLKKDYRFFIKLSQWLKR